MGGRSGKAGLFIVPENPNLTIGKELTGVVNLNIVSKIPKAKLFFRFLGKEIIKNSSGQKLSDSKICQKQMLLHDWNGPGEAGQYTFPFVFTIPEELPGSFDYKGRTQIKYWIKAVIVDKNSKKIASDRCEIHVLPVYNEIFSSIYMNQNFIVRCCGCCSKGSINAGARMNKDVYYPSEVGSLIIEIENSKNKAKINGLTVHFIRNIATKTGFGKIQVDSECLFVDEVRKSIPSKVSLLSEQALTVDVPFNTFKDKIENAASTKGSIIECRYFIKIFLSFGCCISQRFLEVDVKMYPEDLDNRLPPPPPPDWRPTSMPTNRFSSLEFTEYQPNAPYLDEI